MLACWRGKRWKSSLVTKKVHSWCTFVLVRFFPRSLFPVLLLFFPHIPPLLLTMYPSSLSYKGWPSGSWWPSEGSHMTGSPPGTSRICWRRESVCPSPPSAPSMSTWSWSNVGAHPTSSLTQWPNPKSEHNRTCVRTYVCVLRHQSVPLSLITLSPSIARRRFHSKVCVMSMSEFVCVRCVCVCSCMCVSCLCWNWLLWHKQWIIVSLQSHTYSVMGSSPHHLTCLFLHFCVAI